MPGASGCAGPGSGKNTAALKRLVLEVDIASQPPSFLLWVADVLEPDPGLSIFIAAS